VTDTHRTVAKIVLCGALDVGTTALRQNCIGENFPEDHLSDLGAEFAVKRIKMEDRGILELQIWHIYALSGKNLKRKFFKGAKAAFFVFDVAREKTLYALESWFKQLWQYNSKLLPVAILGNVTDPEEIHVNTTKVEKFITNLRKKHSLSDTWISYFTTSSKDCEHIEKLFDEIAQILYQSLKV
jgi:GTPase SAR1 family protein